MQHVHFVYARAIGCYEQLGLELLDEGEKVTTMKISWITSLNAPSQSGVQTSKKEVGCICASLKRKFNDPGMYLGRTSS